MAIVLVRILKILRPVVSVTAGHQPLPLRLLNLPQMIVIVVIKEVLFLMIHHGRIIILLVLQHRGSLRLPGLDAWVSNPGSNPHPRHALVRKEGLQLPQLVVSLLPLLLELLLDVVHGFEDLPLLHLEAGVGHV